MRNNEHWLANYRRGNIFRDSGEIFKGDYVLISKVAYHISYNLIFYFSLRS